MTIKLAKEQNGIFYTVEDDGREIVFGGPEPDEKKAIEAAKEAVRFHFEDELAHAHVVAA